MDRIMKGILYIGLRGLAGCGKDTVGCFLNYILEHFDLSKEECIQNFNMYPKKIFGQDYASKYVTKIAFADQLKRICSMIFGVPIDAFYNGNKANAWVCLNRGFEYTETKPNEADIINAYDYYNMKEKNKAYWMSIRELMVYVGTYILQKEITPNIFVNIVENTIKRNIVTNKDLKYVICTDVRFAHELDYVHNKFGVVINIINHRVNKPLNNIAETSLSDSNNYDFVIENNGTYADLFEQVYDLVHDNLIFSNNVLEIETRSLDSDIYLREEEPNLYKVCTLNHMNRMEKSDDNIEMIDPSGGPTIRVNEVIKGTNKVPLNIYLDDDFKFILELVDNENI